jgi:hypothetical protein
MQNKEFDKTTKLGDYLATNPFSWIEKSKAKREARRIRLASKPQGPYCPLNTI